MKRAGRGFSPLPAFFSVRQVFRVIDKSRYNLTKYPIDYLAALWYDVSVEQSKEKNREKDAITLLRLAAGTFFISFWHPADHMFEGCTALESVNITNISGDKLEDEDYNFYSRDPIAEAVKNCKNLTDVKMSTDFIDNAMKKLGFATPEAVLDDFLKGCPNADLLKAKLLEQYNSEEYYDAIYTWATDNTSCTASRQNKKTNKITKETVKSTVETTESSCTVAGKIVYTAVFTNSLFTTQTRQDVLSLKEHTPGDAEIENKVPASCTAKGSYDEVVYCEVCHAELSRDTKTIDELGHKFEFAGFEWSEDSTSAKAKFDCSHENCDEFELHEAEVTSKTTNPTCTEDGKIVYTAVYGENTDTKEETLPATGHSFTTFAGFEWSEDFTSAQAKFDCSNDGCDKTELFEAEVTFEKQGNTTVYTATYTHMVDGAEKTETEQKTVEDEVKPDFTIYKRFILEGTIVYQFGVKDIEGLENPQLTVSRVGADTITLDPIKDKDDDLYIFSISLPVKELNDKLKLQFSCKWNGEEFKKEEEEYSFRDYLKGQMTVLQDDDVVTRDQIATLAEFAAKAQLYFGHNTADLANADLKDVYKEVVLDESVITEAKTKTVAECENAKAEFIGHTFELEADTYMMLGYKALENAEFSTDDLYLAYRVADTDEEFMYSKVKDETYGGVQYTTIKLKAHELNNEYEYYLCTSSDGKSYTPISNIESYSAMCYAWEQISKEDKSAKQLKLNDLVTAMMIYADASEAYNEAYYKK